MGGLAVGLGSTASNISQAQRESFAEQMEKRKQAFNERRVTAQEQYNRDKESSLEAYRNRSLDMRNQNKRLQDAEQSARYMMGIAPDAPIPPEKAAKLQALVGALLLRQSMIDRSVVADPNSGTGFSKEFTNIFTGDEVGKPVTNIKPTGAAEKKPTLDEAQATKLLQNAIAKKDPNYLYGLDTATKDYVRKVAVDSGLDKQLTVQQQAAFNQQWGMQHEREAFSERKAGSAANDVLGSLNVLHVGLFGGKDPDSGTTTTGLVQSLGILDDASSRRKMIAVGSLLGLGTDKSMWARLAPDFLTNMATAGVVGTMSEEEKEYMYQMQRAATGIGALRNITGKMRPTEALIQRMMRELPDPISTTSALDGLRKIALIQREIDAYTQAAKRASTITDDAEVPDVYSGPGTFSMSHSSSISSGHKSKSNTMVHDENNPPPPVK